MENKTLGEAELRPKNQITIPPDVVDSMNLSTGDFIVFDEVDGIIVICRAIMKKVVRNNGKKNGCRE